MRLLASRREPPTYRSWARVRIAPIAVIGRSEDERHAAGVERAVAMPAANVEGPCEAKRRSGTVLAQSDKLHGALAARAEGVDRSSAPSEASSKTAALVSTLGT